MLYDYESERTLIGSVFWRPSIFAEITSAVRTEDFYHPSHRVLWDGIVDADKRGLMLDAETIANHLADRGDLDRLQGVGGHDYFCDVIDHGVVSANIRYHIRRVTEKARRRQMQRFAAALAVAAVDDTPDAEFFSKAETAMLETESQRRSIPGLVNARQAFRKLAEALERAMMPNAVPETIATGVECIDNAMGGFRRASLVVMAARPGGGKSSLLGQVMANGAMSGIGCLVFSPEMSAYEYAERIASGYGLDTARLRAGQLRPTDHIAITRAASAYSEPVNLWIDESGEISIADLRSRARRWRLNEGARFERILIGVDYLQLVSGEGETRQLEIASVSRGLKALAKELDCPVIAAAQLNRALESRADKRPTQADLRESGQIEQDADMIMFLHRPCLFEEAKTPEQARAAEIIIAKNRGGMVGTIHAEFIAEKTTFQ